MIDKAKMSFANWWHDANLTFNVALSKFYQPAINVMIVTVSRLKGFLLHELR